MLPRCLALLLLLAAPTAAQELSTAISAVVSISGTRGDTGVRGSGFVVSVERGKATVVTAAHVIAGVHRLEVTFAADLTESFPAGTVLGMDAASPNGLAVFQVRGTLPAGVTALSFEAGSPLQLGEDVFLLGFPQRASVPLTLRRTFAGPKGNLLQLDLPVGEGFSGAPVLRREGTVVGVVTEADLQLTFAVKALVARDAVAGWQVKLSSQPPLPIVENCMPGEERTEAGIVYARICSGTFIMGSAGDDPQADDDEKPAHQVTVTEFWLSKTEITNEQYRRFRPDHPGESSLPATKVSWAEAEAACEHFGGHLPTEAQWEYAARANSRTTWSFGNQAKNLGDYAWYGESMDSAPHPAGTKKANAWGLHDMHGNIWEWVADWYGPYAIGAQTDPQGPSIGKYRVYRGGAFNDLPGELRSASRFRNSPFLKYRDLGFRCAHSPNRQPP